MSLANPGRTTPAQLAADPAFPAAVAGALQGDWSGGLTGAQADDTPQEVARDQISLMRFIPKAQRAAIRAGTSTYDCSAAFQAAHDSGLSDIFVPPGRYTRESNRTLITRSGIRWRGIRGRSLLYTTTRADFFQFNANVSDVSFDGLAFQTDLVGVPAGGVYAPGAIWAQDRLCTDIRVTNCVFRLGQSQAAAVQLIALAAAYGYQRVTFEDNECVGAGNGFFAILNNVPALASGTCQAGGTSTTAVIAASDAAATGAYVGKLLILVAGTRAGEYSLITANDGTTKVLTLATTLPSGPDATSTYIIVDPTARNRSINVRRNLFKDAGQNPQAVDYATCVSISGFCDDVEISGNTFDNPLYAAIELVRGRDSRIKDNDFVNVDRITRLVTMTDASFNSQAYNNEVSGNKSVGLVNGYFEIWVQDNLVFERNVCAQQLVAASGQTLTTAAPLSMRNVYRGRIEKNVLRTGAGAANSLYLESSIGRRAQLNDIIRNTLDNRGAGSANGCLMFSGTNTTLNRAIDNDYQRVGGGEANVQLSASRNTVRGMRINDGATYPLMIGPQTIAVTDSGSATLIGDTTTSTGILRLSGGSLTAIRTVTLSRLGLDPILVSNTYAFDVNLGAGGATTVLHAGKAALFVADPTSLALTRLGDEQTSW